MEYLGKAVGCVSGPIVNHITPHLGYITCYKQRVEKLKQEVRYLELVRDAVAHQVREAWNNAKKPTEVATTWLEEVERKIIEIKEFLNNDDHKKTEYSSGILDFLKYRHKLGEQATHLAEDLQDLFKKEPKPDQIAFQEESSSHTNTTSARDYVKFESREKTVEGIMEKLKDPTVRLIGVHGPGGVGKTTLVNQIAVEAGNNKLFDVVVQVEIKRNPNLREIQENIAYPLGLNFQGEGEKGRADRLRRRLSQNRQSILVILDDLWDGLDLDMLGIPFVDDDDSGNVTGKDRKDVSARHQMAGKENPSNDNNGDKDSSGVYKGCKILLTSRIEDVLTKKMNVKKNSVFPLMPLNDEEALILFKKVAEIQGDDFKFKLDNLIKNFGGLPIAINTLGRALKNTTESDWKNAVGKFARQEEVQNSMEIVVKMSYDHLENEELQSIFLLCAKIGHQPLVMDLVKYCFVLDIFKDVHSLTGARDRISDSIKKLRNSSLMLDCNSKDQFSMHDMVRDAALSVAYKERHEFILRNDKREYWPGMDELERFTVISIYKSVIVVDELPEVINCPKLRVFHFDSDDPCLKIPDRFFEGMQGLLVLVLVGIRQLPSSIKCLSNLRMLCLERCQVDDLSIIGNMKKLRILSLAGSKIKDWPTKSGDLSNLKLLDISDCSIGSMIPPNFISSLTCLEELYIGKSLIKEEAKGGEEQSQLSILTELKYLSHLKIIDVYIPSAESLPKDVFFDKLNNYKIVIGDIDMLSVDFKMPNKYEASRSLVLHLKPGGADIHFLNKIKILFERVENLLLGELNGVRNAFPELNLNGFSDLKHLSIINDNDIEYVVDSMVLPHLQGAFPSLESLSLFNLTKMKMICRSHDLDVSFSRLKSVKVNMCPNLKNLFSIHLVKFLTSLETIDVSKCGQVEEIIDAEQGELSDKVEFHQLLSITLQDLRSLMSFCTNKEMYSTSQCVANQAGHTEIVPLENKPSIRTSLSIFGEKVEIPNLQSLNLSSINAREIWSRKFSYICFQQLIKLTVQDCPNLEYLCSLSVASNLKKLKGLFVSNCLKMEKLFICEENCADFCKDGIFPELEEIQLTDMNMLKQIWPNKVCADSFSRLISLHIRSCNMLDMIFPSHMQGWHQSLESLEVAWCRSVEVIFEIRCPLEKDHAHAADTKLQLIHLSYLKNLKQVWSGDPERVFKFTMMRRIDIYCCHELRIVLPASVAKGLEKLEELRIEECQKMRTIVEWVETSEIDNKSLVFPNVTSIEFGSLQLATCFYMGRHTIKCPNLKRLKVSGCPKLKTFTIESEDEEGMKPIFLDEKVISSLEYLYIDSKQAEWLKSNISNIMLHLRQLHFLSLPSVEILWWFLHRIPNLERLNLTYPDNDIRVLVPSGNTEPQQRLGSVLQLKELNVWSANIKDIVFESDQVLQRLERLVLFMCHKLIRLAQSSVCLTHLTYLEVRSCGGLKNLMAPSTAKSLVQLTTMKVEQCPELKEIVNSEGNEENAMDNIIVFAKLVTIEFDNLQNLTSFCNSSKCEFSFPLLEKLILRECHKMKTFTERRIKAPKLQYILVNQGNQKEKVYWEGNFNDTINDSIKFCHQDYLGSISYLELSKFPELEQIWCGKDLVHMQCNWFGNVKELVVQGCAFLVHVIPSHLLACFRNLEELRVWNCSEVKVIFNIDIDNKVANESRMFRLKRLSLSNLPKLEHVFPASMVKDLAILKELEISYCKQLVEIFSEDKKVSSGEETKSVAFHCLTSLKLIKLPRLKCFHGGMLSLEFHLLKKLHLDPCKWMILECQEAYLEEQVLTPNEKVHLSTMILRLLNAI